MDPTSYTAWGPLGAVVFLVVMFGVFLVRRDKEWRDFFTGIRQTDADTITKLTTAIEKLVLRIESLEGRFETHDATEMEFLRGIVARFGSKTQPRNKQ